MSPQKLIVRKTRDSKICKEASDTYARRSLRKAITSQTINAAQCIEI